MPDIIIYSNSECSGEKSNGKDTEEKREMSKKREKYHGDDEEVLFRIFMSHAVIIYLYDSNWQPFDLYVNLLCGSIDMI